MATYRVFYIRKEYEYADIEADSILEAERLAEENYSEHDWNYVVDSAEYELTDETELLHE